MYRPLLVPPQIDIESELDDIVLDDLDLDANTMATIQERVRAKHTRDKVRIQKALTYSNRLTKKVVFIPLRNRQCH